jgi:nitrogen regulatory protein PII
MKIITAIVQPFKLSKVTSALEQIDGFPGMTVTDVRGFGREKSSHIHEENGHGRGIEDLVEYIEKSRIEIVASDEIVDEIVETIARVAHTGNRGDGKIFVWSVERAVRIKTGETGAPAVSGKESKPRP